MATYKLLYQSDFFKSSEPLLEPEGETANYQTFRRAGYYHLMSKRGGWQYRHLPIEVSDFGMQVEGQFLNIDGNITRSWGVLFRQSTLGFYSFEINRDQKFSFDKVHYIAHPFSQFEQQGRPVNIIPWQSSRKILSGTDTNTLGVVVSGTIIKLAINNHIIATVEDSQFASGFIAFFVQGTEARFRDLRLYDEIKSGYDDRLLAPKPIHAKVELHDLLPQITTNPPRQPIPKSVQREVWRRDEGKCTECGSKINLEYDHIIPLSKGGSNTARNIQLLCESCNRKKSNKIGG